jgi:acyl-CoA synthetase (NDP forming)
MSFGVASPHALSKIFHPESVAVVGASATNLVAAGPLRNLLAHGFKGRIYPVNPRHEEIQGLRCYPSLSALPEAPDTVIITVPAAKVDGVLAECDQLGIDGGSSLPRATNPHAGSTRSGCSGPRPSAW